MTSQGETYQVYVQELRQYQDIQDRVVKRLSDRADSQSGLARMFQSLAVVLFVIGSSLALWASAIKDRAPG